MSDTGGSDEATPRYVYEEEHEHVFTDPDCVKCWQRIAHQSQLQGALLAEQVAAMATEREKLQAEVAILTLDNQRLSGIARAKALTVDQLTAEVARLRGRR